MVSTRGEDRDGDIFHDVVSVAPAVDFGCGVRKSSTLRLRPNSGG